MSIRATRHSTPSRFFAYFLRTVMLTVLIAGVVAGCTTRSYPPAPREVPGAADYAYKIGPLDTVNIIVWRNPDLSMVVPVRPDGKISTPLVPDIVALNKTPAELQTDIERALSKFIRDPVVTVIVTTFVVPTGEQIRV